jgi:hypothetical protein
MLTESEWDLIIELLQVLGPIEEVTTCLGGSKYTTHSLLYRLIQSLKKRFKLHRVLNNELNFDTDDDVFENDDIEYENQEECVEENNQIKINLPVNTNNILNQVKKNMYQAHCYYFPTPAPEE